MKRLDFFRATLGALLAPFLPRRQAFTLDDLPDEAGRTVTIRQEYWEVTGDATYWHAPKLYISSTDPEPGAMVRLYRWPPEDTP